MSIKIKDVSEAKSLTVKLEIDGNEVPFTFMFDENDPAGAELNIGSAAIKVRVLRQLVAAFIDRYPLELDE